MASFLRRRCRAARLPVPWPPRSWCCQVFLSKPVLLDQGQQQNNGVLSPAARVLASTSNPATQGLGRSPGSIGYTLGARAAALRKGRLYGWKRDGKINLNNVKKAQAVRPFFVRQGFQDRRQPRRWASPWGREARRHGCSRPNGPKVEIPVLQTFGGPPTFTTRGPGPKSSVYFVLFRHFRDDVAYVKGRAL